MVTVNNIACYTNSLFYNEIYSSASDHSRIKDKMAANHQYDTQASTNYKEAFALFDKRGNQRVALESLGDLLRACGQNPTLSEIRDLEKNVGSDCAYTIYASIHQIYNPANGTQLTLKHFRKSSIVQVVSAIQESLKNIAAVSRFLIRT